MLLSHICTSLWSKESNATFTNMKIHNFSSGPAILPAEVMQQAAAACLDFNGMGLSILEISHRSKEFLAVLSEAEALIREILGIGDEYGVLFLSGGGSSQFYMTAMNLLGSTEKAAFVDTGLWSSNAIKEAKLFGQVEVVASSKDKNYTYIPKGFEIPEDTKYLHITSNNTIRGTQYHNYPETTIPIVSDASSDIFSRPLDISKFGLIYASAQKNVGPAGVTLVIVKKELLGKTNRAIPTMLDYRVQIANESSFNTPPVFPIYVSMLNLRWVKAQGGMAAMAKKNAQKAALMYAAIDRNPLFTCPVEKEDRSIMNAVFRLKDESLEVPFLKLCAEAGCSGVKGHRSVGGFRASMYNAMDLESVQVLVGVMDEFAQHYG